MTTSLAQRFADSQPQGISNVSRDASGALVAWVENGCALSVARGAGFVSLTLQIGNARAVETIYYNTAGQVIKTEGEFIPTGLRGELLQWSSTGRPALRAATNPDGNTVGIADPEGGVRYLDRCLKNFTGANQLTGGTVNTKTLLMQVSLPNGLLLDYRTSLRISAIFGFSLNTNNKSFGIDIGTTFAGATNLWARSRTSATSGADSVLLNLQRSPTLPTDILLSYGGPVPYEGTPNVNTALYAFPYHVDPTAAGLSLFFWGTLVMANTDQITLARALVESVTGEQ